MTDERIEVLRGALDVLDERGWNQGSMVGADNSLCLVGALCLGANYDLDYHVRNSVRNSVECDLAVRLGCPVPAWNDAPSTTVEDVKQLLKQAIYDLENESAAVTA